jgi:photosystem II stability/assembly factor-like uncharacterized protein
MKKVILVIVSFILFFSMNVKAQWSEQTSGVTTSLYSVSAIDNDNIWICGASGKVLRSINGGTNWVQTASPNATLDLYNIWGVDANTAFVTGSGTTAYVYKTINGGANWTLVFSQVGGFMDAIVKVGSANTYAIFGDPVGGRWSIFVTENDGSTWDSTGLYIPQAGSETGYNNSVFIMQNGNHDYIYFGTTNSRIYKGIDGQNWVAQPTVQTDILTISFYDSLGGFAGGTTGGMFTSNGGVNWGNYGPVIGSGSINGMAYTHEGMYYTRGSSVYFSPTGYVFTAATTQTGTYNHLTSPRTISSNNIWAIRNNGGISKFTSSVGINPISTEVPSKYSLSQNYPNPFNPTTKIKFAITKLSEVKIVVFDAMGREVQTLVNEKLQAGTYETTFDGSQLTSGVYFYKISSGDFSETKKMLMVK